MHFFKKPDGDIGYRVAVVMEDHTLLMLQNGGLCFVSVATGAVTSQCRPRYLATGGSAC